MFNIEHEGGDMMFDYSKLLGRIKEIAGTQGIFAEMIGLSERTVSLKLNNERDWTQDDIEKTCEVLRIKRKEIPKYFFATKVQD